MEGRRVNHSAPKRNPLYVMFLCLVAAVFVLLIVVIVLGAKLGAAQKAAKGAETQIEELQEQVKKLERRKEGRGWMPRMSRTKSSPARIRPRSIRTRRRSRIRA